MKSAIFTLLLLCSVSAFGQDISEENYLREDAELWEKYERGELSMQQGFEQNVALAMKYSTTPSGFERLFMVRNLIPKQRLGELLDAAPEELRLSEDGRNIRAWLDTEQVGVGQRYFDFEAVTDDDKPFRLSQLEGRNILLIYGGLGCMGQTLEMWNNIYAATSRDDFEIVVISQGSDKAALRRERVNYPNNFVIVGDFLGNASPMKINYGAQGTPTYVLTGRDGVVLAAVYQDLRTGGDNLNKQMIDHVLGGDAALMTW